MKLPWFTSHIHDVMICAHAQTIVPMPLINHSLAEPDPYAGGGSGDLLYTELFYWNAIIGHFT